MYDFTLLDANDTLPAKHEGILTKQYGVLPPKGIPTKMPESHAAWDNVAASLPTLIQSNTATQILKALPVLDASENSFSDEYLSRASIILNSFARAYYYHSTESDLQKRDVTDPLPASITKPWEHVSKRLGRNVSLASRTIYDNVICNWQITNPDKHELSTLTINDIDLLVNVTGNQEERVLFLSIVLMEIKFGPALAEMFYAVENMKNKDDNAILKNIDAIIMALQAAQPLFSLLSQHSKHPTHVDPQNWHSSVIKLESPCRHGEKGGGGAATSLFHFMDAFIGRTYDTEFGKLLLSYRPLFPQNVFNFIKFIEHNSVAEYTKKSGNTELSAKFRELLSVYMELLSTHRRKAVSFIEGMSDSSAAVEEANKLNHGLLEAMTEREATFEPQPDEARIVSNTCLAKNVHEIILSIPQNQTFKPGDKCVLSAREIPGRLYSVSPVTDTDHPQIRLTIKAVGKTSAHLCSLQKNQTVNIKKPYSPPFELTQDPNTPIIMFAGGTGISPFIGFIDERKKSPHTKNILFVGTRNEESFYYKDRLEQDADKGHIDCHVIYSQQQNKQGHQGYIDTLISQHTEALAELITHRKAAVYICGSVEFSTTVKNSLNAIPHLMYTVQEDTFTHPNRHQLKPITLKQLKESKAEQKIWVAINQFIYDLTEFALYHPGGESVITRLAGTVIDEAYQRAHGKTPEIDSYLQNYKMGVLKREKITIVGGGLSGIVLAAFLAKENKNFDITVYDNLPDPRDVQLSENRSINITLCERGLIPLDEIGVREAVVKQCVRVKGRMIHASDNHVTEQLYGNNGESLYSINRAILAKTLLTSVSEQYPEITFHYNHSCESLDLPNTTATFKDSTGAVITVKSDRILGADGVGSKVRSHLEALVPVEKTQYQHHQAYKEIKLPADADGFPLNPNYLHIWPRDNFMLIGFPNTNGSFTLSFFFPAHNPPQDYDAFFKMHFPDIHEKISESLKAAALHPVGRMTTLRCSPWIYEDKVALIGDAAHAIFPYFGQGANSAFEDSKVLMQCYRKNPGNWGAILSDYQSQRKPNTDVISHLAENHFTTLSHNVGDQTYLEKQKIALELQKTEKSSSTLYHNISFTDMPYKEAKERDEQLTIRVEEIYRARTTGLLFFSSPRINANKTTSPSSLPQFTGHK